MQQHEKYMQRAIDLAYLGAGSVSPNPMVGAVIVHNDRIIGEGYHQRFGEAHAEIHALNSVADHSLLPESILYVTLEPCSHYGKTPPCAEAIIKSGIRHVVTGITDPNPLVSGKGIQMLRSSGIRVDEGILPAGCMELNKRFICFIKHKRPYIILKWAQTANGYIAPDREKLGPEAFEQQRHITGLIAQKLTHKWRTEEDAIMVGTTTVATDNPRLDARAWNGRHPVRVILDLNNRLAHESYVFDGSRKTIVFVSDMPGPKAGIHYERVSPEQSLTRQISDALYRHSIQSLVVEGGAQLLRTFINDRLWDEAQVLTSPKRFDAGVKAPEIGGLLFAETLLDQNRLSILKPR